MTPATVDHLIVAARDLERAVDWTEERLGVRPYPGGRHPGIGTRNALLSLGNDVYVEVVGVDPDQPEPPRPRWFGLDEIEEPRLVTWCARTPDLDEATARAEAAGVALGGVQEGSRERTDGAMLRWRVTDPWASRAGGVVPFLIDWLDSPHPGAGEGLGWRVASLHGVHPEPGPVQASLDALGLPVTVEGGASPGLRAVLETPSGSIELG